MLTTSIQTVYNIDATFGWLLGHSTIPLVANLTATSINLDDLNLHDAIEHDASLSRNDFANRLVKAGCVVNRTGTDWAKAGVFAPTEPKSSKKKPRSRWAPCK